jgi:hypothetical protein
VIEVDAAPGARMETSAPPGAFCVERAGGRLRFVQRDANPVGEATVRGWFPGASRIEIRNASLREIFVALASGPGKTTMMAEAHL